MLSNGVSLTLGALFDEALPLTEAMLVVLSACETGIADPLDLADEYIGLAGGLLFAGAPAVIATLWKVDDLATMLIMEDFYRRLLTPSDEDSGYLRPAAAMRNAQIWLRDLRADATTDYLGAQRLDVVVAALAREQDGGPVPPAPSSDALEKLAWILGRQVKPVDRPFANPYYWGGFTVVGAHALPMKVPGANTSDPPTTTRSVARQNGVSM